MIFAKGAKLTIEGTEDARASLAEAEAQVPGSKEGCKAQLMALIQRLADIGKIFSPEQMRLEEDGIFALKARCGLRAYGWFHRQRRGVFVISHFVMKKAQKLDRRDLERARQNRNQYEDTGQ